MNLHADKGRCIGAGMCALTAPAVFDQDDDEGLVILLDASPPPDQHTAVRLAVGHCPASALTLLGKNPGPS
ncbi:ferredoxin [Streptomyces sp. NPDC012888]|uniref:ferredoxin n=1 Tax=Streptomyces sp. NPDC012888 TaxID=3364855 RepID=UPI00369B3EFF